MCLSVCATCAWVPAEAREGIGAPGAGQLQTVLSHPVWVLSTKLQSQRVFLTTEVFVQSEIALF